jgi:tetratricopeptide (TPR) repeat protein
MRVNRRSWQVAGLLAAVLCLSLPARGRQTPEDARAEARAGRFEEAAAIYRHIMQAHPDNVEALAGLVDALDARGQWRDAIAPLTRLVELQPENASRSAQLGRWESWLGGKRAQALAHLKRAATLAPENPTILVEYAEVLSWSAAGRPEAIRILRGVLEQHPEDVPAIARLAEILSWDDTTRAEARRWFERGLSLEPGNPALLVPHAEMLSWSGATRTQAMEEFDRVLATDPGNVRALDGRAQLLLWTGHSDEALALFEKVLALDASNVNALRGKAKILDNRGNTVEAHWLLQHAQNENPDDPETMVALARTNYELHQYSEARSLLERARGATGSEVESMQRDLLHATGTFVETGYGLRRNQGRLDYDQPEMLVSTRVGTSNRITFRYAPAFYRTTLQDFTANDFGIALDSEPSERTSLHAELGGETYTGAPPQLDGAIEFHFRWSPSWQFETGFERQAVEDSLLSTRGLIASGIFLGQVRSNLGHIGTSYSSSAHHYDFSVSYEDGMYTGRGLASNRRKGVDLNLGKSVRSDRPYVRLAYGFSYVSFDHDDDFQPGEATQRVTGGYFSPTTFLVNYGSIVLSQKLSRWLELEGGGTMGVQNVETTSSRLSNAQFASTASALLVWHIGPRDDLRMGYEFLNVFNAFDRNLYRVSWRHYF